MSGRFDTRSVSEAVGVLAALVALACFARTVAPTLSLTVQSALLGLAGVVTLVGAGTTGWGEGLTYLAILLFVGGAAYGASTHPIGADGTVALALGTMAVALVVVFLHQGHLLALRPREAVAVLLILALVGGGLVGADLRADPVNYEIRTPSETQVPADPAATEALAVGTATATNPSPFREQVAFPPARACLFNGTARVTSPVLYMTDGEYYPRGIGGSGTIEARMTVFATAATVESMNRTVPVERRQSCPERSGRQRIVVVVTGAD